MYKNKQSNNRKKGDKAEKMALSKLQVLGFKKVDKQETGIKVFNVMKRLGAKVLAWFFYSEKAPIDFIALKKGVYYSIEVKHTLKIENLPYSRFSKKCISEMENTLAEGGKVWIIWIDYAFRCRIIKISDASILYKRGSFKWGELEKCQ